MKDILDSLQEATKIEKKRLHEADAQQQQPQPQASDSSQSSQQLDGQGIEKAFEQALDSMKQDIIKEMQGMMEKFGEQMVQKLKGEQTSSSNSSNDNGSQQQSGDGQQQQDTNK
jgi:hypothetical protein